MNFNGLVHAPDMTEQQFSEYLHKNGVFWRIFNDCRNVGNMTLWFRHGENPDDYQTMPIAIVLYSGYLEDKHITPQYWIKE